MKNRVIRLFLDTDMRLQHRGLEVRAGEEGVNLKNLKSGDHVVFINTALNRVKMCSKGNVLSYIYKDEGKIDLHIFEEIAAAFNNDGSVTLDQALKKTLSNRLLLSQVRKS